MRKWKCIHLDTNELVKISETEHEMIGVEKTIEKYEQQGWILFSYNMYHNYTLHRLLFFKEIV